VSHPLAKLARAIG
jgi:hypothetical protein